MLKLKLTLEYDGSRFAGWQVQAKDKTVQGELIKACQQVFETDRLEVYGAGRTDAGVHARGQVAHVALGSTRLTPEVIQIRLNDALPHDINIRRVEKVSPNFHARHDAQYREYVYQISKRRDAFAKKYVWWVRDRLQVPAMQSAAALLRGFHDFRSFGEIETTTQSTLVDLTRLDITEDTDRIYIRIGGSHFLWKMVRRMVGILVEVGRGNLTTADVAALLEKPSREPARFTAPPAGLFLEKIEY